MSSRTDIFRRILLAALVLLAIHLAVRGVRSLFRDGSGTLPETVEMGPLMPADGGLITDLAIQFHRPGADPILVVYGELLAALDPRTTVHVVVSDAEDRRAFEEARARWFADRRGPTVRYVDAGRPITSWIHDRLLVLDPAEPDGPTAIVAPPEPHQGATERVNDWTVPWVLRDHLGERGWVRTAPFRFEGGDLIGDASRVFVSTRLARHNESKYRSRESLVREVSEVVGREVVLLGSEEQPAPDHHVGMYLVPLGGDRIAVGDPDLALSLLREAGDLPEADEEGNVALSVGGRPLALDLSDGRLEELRAVARQLEADGFSLVRLPLLPARQAYAIVSYNNAMLERREDGLHVYMPAYGIPALDGAATATYEAIGARVHPIRVERIFRMGGSVGCLVAPLGRAPVSS